MTKRTYNQTPKQIELKILNLYLKQKLSSVKIKKILNVCHGTVFRVLKSYGYKPRNLSEVKIKHHYNHDFFNEINTEEKAYWLGFILADGSLSEREVIIALSSVDIDHLRKFAKAVGSSQKLKIKEATAYFGNKSYKTKSARIAVRSDQMLKDLLKYGVCRRKTWESNLDYKKIPTAYQRHFWRGVIDGDGSLGHYLQQSIYTMYEISLVGNNNVIDQYIDFINNTLNINLKKYKHKSIFRSQTSGKKALLIMDLLYQNAEIFLERKMQKYLEIKKLAKQKK